MLLLSRMCSEDSGSSLAEFAFVFAGFLLASSVIGLVIGAFFGLLPMVLEFLGAKKNGNRVAATYKPRETQSKNWFLRCGDSGAWQGRSLRGNE